MNKTIYIYIDDLRVCPQDTQDKYIVITARNAETAIDTINFFNSIGQKVIVDFDHDLGDGPSGYDIAKYIVENQVPIVGYTIHSMNPIGVFNINQLLSHYGYVRMT